MKDIKYFIGGFILVGGIMAALKMRQTIPEGAIPVKPFDKNKYLGKWYEIARMDYRFEKNMNNTMAEYSQNSDGSIKVINSGYNYKKQKIERVVGKALFVKDPEEARLKVTFFGPCYSGYNVIAIDTDYKYALVAGRNLRYLWILSRETTIPEDIKKSYLEKAAEIGYDTSKLVWVKHNW